MNEHNRSYCPNCGGVESEHLHTEKYSDHIEEIRGCQNEDCMTEWANQFSLDGKEVIGFAGGSR